MELSLASLQNRFLRRARPQAVLGMDLGMAGVKLVGLKRNHQVLAVSSHFFYPERVVESDPLCVARFREFLQSHNLSGMAVACNVDDPSLKVRRLDLPKMPDYDLKEAVKWEMRDTAEGAIDQYAVRYSSLDQYQVGETERLALMVYAVRKEVVGALTTLMKKLLLKPILIEPTPVALLASLDRLLSWEKGVVYVVLDLGEGRSDFFAVSEGKLFFSRPLLDVSGNSFTKMIAGEFSLDPAEAHSLKESLFHSEQRNAVIEDERLQTVLPAFYSRVAVETQRSLDAFSITYHREKVERIFLCGGGAALPGLEDYLGKNVGLKVVRFDPLEGLWGEGEDHHLYSVATGLALYGL